MIQNHYGITVDSEKPVTGVFQNNRVEFLSEELGYGEFVDLGGEQCFEEAFPDEPDPDMYNDASDLLLGFMETKKMREALFWYPKRNIGYKPKDDAPYSAVVRESTTQVVKSEWLVRGALCSPCYPGQVDCDTPGEFLGYSFPPDVLGEDAKNYKIFKIGREKK